MAISIKTHFHPFRLLLNRRQPVQLKIELENNSADSKMVSMQLILPRQLSLDKGGLVTSSMKRIKALAPNAVETFYFDLHPKLPQEGALPLQLKVMEHYNDFNFVQQEYTKNLVLKVE